MKPRHPGARKQIGEANPDEPLYTHLTRKVEYATLQHWMIFLPGLDPNLTERVASAERRGLDEDEFIFLVELLAGLEPLDLDAIYLAAQHYRQFEEKHKPFARGRTEGS